MRLLLPDRSTRLNAGTAPAPYNMVGLGGAKISIIVVDHQGKPEVGQSETERLITQEKVHAVFGAYFSSVTAAASQAADHHTLPRRLVRRLAPPERMALRELRVRRRFRMPWF